MAPKGCGFTIPVVVFADSCRLVLSFFYSYQIFFFFDTLLYGFMWGKCHFFLVSTRKQNHDEKYSDPRKSFLVINNFKTSRFSKKNSSKNSKPPRLFTNKLNEAKKLCSKSLAIKTSQKSAKYSEISSMQNMKFRSFFEQFSDHHKNIIYCMLRRVLIHLLVSTFPIE